MYDAHIRCWKRHLEREEMRALLSARYRVVETWRNQWQRIQKHNESLKERPWQT